jgi:hypothetical protein
MDILVEIPIDAYLLCIAMLKLRSPEYLLLRNGIIVSNEQGDRVLQILCNANSAHRIINIISDVCPEFSSKIRQYPNSP